MLRSAFLTLSLAAALGIGAAAQVVTNGGYATTYPVAVTPQMANTVTSEGIPSVPAINTPVAHVGPAAAPPAVPGETSQPAVTPEAEITQPADINQPLNLGVGAVDVNPFLSPGQDTNGQSLGEIARAIKQKDQSINAKTYTNADIDKLNASSGGINAGVTNAQNDNWPANNGVITPEPNNGQGAIASPAQNQSTTGTDNSQPANPPQAFAKPSGDRPYEMAQNNPSNADIPQQSDASNSSTENTSSQNATLPKTASRLPLLGVLGFFSISMGLFVRYQRAKEAR